MTAAAALRIVLLEISKLFSPEDLLSMTPEEIERKCDEVLWHDDYEWNKTERIKFETNGKPCTHLHDLCYRCPRCGKEFNMIGENDYIKCNTYIYYLNIPPIIN